MIADVSMPTAGIIKWNGKPIRSLGAKYREQLGFLPQDPGFYPHFTGMQIMQYFADLKGDIRSKAHCEELLHTVNLWEDKDRRIGGYSGGMKHRLGIAVSMLGDPKLLIFDEPTAGLDPKERIRFRNLTAQIAENRIVLYSTHIISDIEGIADDVIMLQDGKLCKIASVEALREELAGKVYTLLIDMESAKRLLAENAVAGYSLQGRNVMLRIIADQSPHPEAKPAIPELEDVYLYYFEKEHRYAVL